MNSHDFLIKSLWETAIRRQPSKPQSCGGLDDHISIEISHTQRFVFFSKIFSSVAFLFLKSLPTMTSKCDVCKIEEAKYTCPRCFTKSCSLKCCKAHKVEKKCNGKRHQTGRDIKDFDETVLKSDYHFLHNIVRESDGASRDLRAKKRRKVRGRVLEFKKKGEERKRDIRIMPAGMEKRQIKYITL